MYIYTYIYLYIHTDSYIWIHIWTHHTTHPLAWHDSFMYATWHIQYPAPNEAALWACKYGRFQSEHPLAGQRRNTHVCGAGVSLCVASLTPTGWWRCIAARPYEHVKILKGQPSRFVLKELVPNWYFFPAEYFGRAEKSQSGWVMKPVPHNLV